MRLVGVRFELGLQQRDARLVELLAQALEERVRGLSRQLVALGVMPVAPHLYLPQLLDEVTEREQALRFCLELVDTCDEVRVFGGRVTAGMKREVEYAKRRGIPVRFETEVLA